MLFLFNKLKSEFYTLIVCNLYISSAAGIPCGVEIFHLLIVLKVCFFFKLIIAPFESRRQPAQTEFINDHSTKITPKLNTSVRWFTDLIDTEWAVNSGKGKKAAIYLHSMVLTS